MDQSTRIDVIKFIHSALSKLPEPEQELLASEFNLPAARDGWMKERPLMERIRLADEDDLLALGSHLSVPTDAAAEAARPEQSDGPLVLFASHVSAHRRFVGDVERALATYGITLFVAHDSITPDSDWQDEIMKALDTCHAGVAFLHKGFPSSPWCDQEVGWLLGRGVPVFSLMFDTAPYGPLGKRQAINAGGFDAGQTATAVLDRVVARTELHGPLATALIEGLSRSTNFGITDRVWAKLRDLRTLDTAQCLALVEVISSNPQVAGPAGGYPFSGLDGGRPYSDVIPEFIAVQPGADDGRVGEKLAEWHTARQGAQAERDKRVSQPTVEH